QQKQMLHAPQQLLLKRMSPRPQLSSRALMRWLDFRKPTATSPPRKPLSKLHPQQVRKALPCARLRWPQVSWRQLSA
ncbi:MAG: hypothetical protein K2X55_19390, partial [Burkholderiaceae bacterium]|nr:hypothetical protein [Burkholderiaceae bacterium]